MNRLLNSALKFRAAFALAGLSVITPFASHGEATVGVPRTEISPTTQITLQGEARGVTFTSLWETELNNNDGFQDGCSMAISGNTLYLCVRQFDPLETGEDRTHIFIRRFDCADGQELTPWIIECPEKYRMLKRSANSATATYSASDYVNFSITNDSFGNLLLLSLSANNDWWNKGNPNITMIPLSTDGKLLTDEAVSCSTATISTDCYNNGTKDLCALTRADHVDGNIASGTYSVSFLPTTVQMPTTISMQENNSDYFIYTTASVTKSESGKLTADINTIPYKRVQMFSIPDIPKTVLRPELHVVAGHEDYAVLSIRKDCDNNSTGAPILLKDANTYLKYLSKANFADMPGEPEEQADKIAIKFYTFMHGNHLMAVYPRTFDAENGAQFVITEWTDPSTFSSLAKKHVEFPSKPFAYPSKIEASPYRQLMLARPVDPEEVANPLSRTDDSNGPVSDLFVCTPGSGIAAVRITPSEIITSVDATFASNGTNMKLDGNTLKVSGDSSEKLIITDLEGRIVYQTLAGTINLSLDNFNAGIYIATCGQSRLKVVVK